jgi:hypothetical protein
MLEMIIWTAVVLMFVFALVPPTRAFLRWLDRVDSPPPACRCSNGCGGHEVPRLVSMPPPPKPPQYSGDAHDVTADAWPDVMATQHDWAVVQHRIEVVRGIVALAHSVEPEELEILEANGTITCLLPARAIHGAPDRTRRVAELAAGCTVLVCGLDHDTDPLPDFCMLDRCPCDGNIE